MFSFFFSSRRRHTRCGRDWSSDVCSSDLKAVERITFPASAQSAVDTRARAETLSARQLFEQSDCYLQERRLPVRPLAGRSEERRVGKERRSLGEREN